MTRSERRRLKKKKVVLEVLAAGGSVAGACSVVSIARCTFYDWQEKDEWFDDGVMAIRRELMLENLSELQAQAYGRYVDEVNVRETDNGVVTTRRHRWFGGKLSALMKLIDQATESAVPEGPGAENVAAVPAGADGAVVSDSEDTCATLVAVTEAGEEAGKVSDSEDTCATLVAVTEAGEEAGKVSDSEANGAETAEPSVATAPGVRDEAEAELGELPAQPEMGDVSERGDDDCLSGDACATGAVSGGVVASGPVSGFERKCGAGVAARKARKAKRKQAKASRRKNRR